MACLLVAAAVVVGLSTASELPREAIWMAGIFVLAAMLWVTEALPLFATSLLVIALQIVLLANPGQWPGLGFETGESPRIGSILAAVADPVLLLFFGGFLLAQAAVKEGVDRSMAGLILRPFGRSAALLLLGIMGVTALFSMWMSNTATAAMMIALVAPILATLAPGERFRKALVLAVAFAANIGGMGTPIGSPPNAVAIGFIRKAGLDISFVQWMVIVVPLMVGLLLLTWVMLYALFRPQTPGLQFAPPPQRLGGRGWFVVAVFTITVILWLSEPLHGLPAAVVALLPAIAFTATRLLSADDVNRLDWNILILIAGGISLGMGMQMTGLDGIIVEAALRDRTITLAAALALLATATLLLGTFMSNTAAANLLLPIGISLVTATAGDDGAAIHYMAIGIALTASLSMALPISTPPNAIVYGTGEISTRDLAVVGATMGIIGTALIILFAAPIVRFWQSIGL